MHQTIATSASLPIRDRMKMTQPLSMVHLGNPKFEKDGDLRSTVQCTEQVARSSQSVAPDVRWCPGPAVNTKVLSPGHVLGVPPSPAKSAWVPSATRLAISCLQWVVGHLTWDCIASYSSSEEHGELQSSIVTECSLAIAGYRCCSTYAGGTLRNQSWWLQMLGTVSGSNWIYVVPIEVNKNLFLYPRQMMIHYCRFYSDILEVGIHFPLQYRIPVLFSARYSMVN